MPRGIENKERAILGAAIAGFARAHYFRATIPEIARAAGVGEGTIYLYFDDKADLAARAYAAAQAALEEAAVAALPEQATPEVQLHALAAALFAGATADPSPLAYGLLARHADFLGAARIAEGDRIGPLVQMILVRGRRLGTLREGDLDVLAALWLAVVRAGLERRLAGELVDAELIAAVAWQGIAAAGVGQIRAAPAGRAR